MNSFIIIVINNNASADNRLLYYYYLSRVVNRDKCEIRRNSFSYVIHPLTKRFKRYHDIILYAILYCQPNIMLILDGKLGTFTCIAV